MTIEDNGVDFSKLTDAEILRDLALRWKDRREALGLKPKMVKHADQQLSFFIGAVQAMELCGRRPPKAVLMLLAVGHDAVELYGKESK